MFERFSNDARQVVVVSQREARELSASYIGTEHLLLGLLTDADDVAASALRRAGLTREGVRESIRAEMSRIGGVDASGCDEDEDARALAAIGIDLPTVRARLEDTFGPGAWERARRHPHPAGRRLWPARFWQRWFWRRGPRRNSTAYQPSHLPFTPRAKKVLELSLREALRLHHGYIGTGHLLLALLREGHGLGVRILAARGLDAADIRRHVLAALDEAA